MKNRTIRDFIIEIVIPVILYILAMPVLCGPIWQNVKSDPNTTWYYLATMNVLSIMIGICWIEFYNCVRLGLFPPKRRR